MRFVRAQIAEFKRRSKYFQYRVYTIAAFALVMLLTIVVVKPSKVRNRLDAYVIAATGDFVVGSYILVRNDSRKDWTDVRFIVNTAPNNAPANLVIRDSQQSSVEAPEDVRSMIIRVSARTRDEDDMWPYVPRGVGAPLTSVRLNGVTSNSARVRSIVSEIAFPNLIGPGQ